MTRDKAAGIGPIAGADTVAEGHAGGAALAPALEPLRRQIEEIDRTLVALIAERVATARAIGAAKRAAGLPLLDPAREAKLMRGIGGMAREAGIEVEELRAIFWQLIAMSRRAQAAGE
jgi:chorismate mutase